jgi:hypothetical protein
MGGGTVVYFSLTPSSAAVCKLVFCGKLLRSKTTKKRLTNCRVREAHGAGAPCYVIRFCGGFAEAGREPLLCLPMQTNTPKRWNFTQKLAETKARKAEAKSKACLRKCFCRRYQNITKKTNNDCFGLLNCCGFKLLPHDL